MSELNIKKLKFNRLNKFFQGKEIDIEVKSLNLLLREEKYQVCLSTELYLQVYFAKLNLKYSGNLENNVELEDEVSEDEQAYSDGTENELNMLTESEDSGFISEKVNAAKEDPTNYR